MAENNGGAAGAAGSGSGETTFTQEQVNAMIGKRVNEITSKYADYDALKEKAGKYDQIQEEGKTDLQKATERADSLQKQVDALTKENTVRHVREKVAAETGIPANLLTGEDEETCRKQAKAMVDYFKPNSYPDVKDNGENNKPGKKSAADDFADWLNKSL